MKDIDHKVTKVTGTRWSHISVNGRVIGSVEHTANATDPWCIIICGSAVVFNLLSDAIQAMALVSKSRFNRVYTYTKGD